MAEIAYLDFDLLIERTTTGYRARVLRSPVGETTGEFQAPLSNLELENFLLGWAARLDRAAFRDASWAGQYPLYLSGWVVDYPDPANFLSPYWSTFSTSRFEAGFPQTWALLKEATVTASPITRAELYAQANDLIKRDVPLVPLVHVGSAAAFLNTEK